MKKNRSISKKERLFKKWFHAYVRKSRLSNNPILWHSIGQLNCDFIITVPEPENRLYEGIDDEKLSPLEKLMKESDKDWHISKFLEYVRISKLFSYGHYYNLDDRIKLIQAWRRPSFVNARKNLYKYIDDYDIGGIERITVDGKNFESSANNMIKSGSDKLLHKNSEWFIVYDHRTNSEKKY